MADSETKKHWLEEKFISIFFGVITTGIVGFAGTSVVSSIDSNTDELKLLRGDLNKINIVYNNKFNQLDNRINLGHEKGTATVKEFRDEHERIWQAIKDLQK